MPYPDMAATALMGAYKNKVKRDPYFTVSRLSVGGWVVGDMRHNTGCPNGDGKFCM